MMKTKKKSQMEIMGLAIVIILITLGIFFFIYYSSVKKPIEQKKEFGNVQLATNIINSILETTTNNLECDGLTFSEVLQKCVQDLSSQCTGGTQATYCDYFKSSVIGIFSQTLDLWVPRYSFLVKTIEPDEYIDGLPRDSFKEECKANEEQIARQFTIPSNPPSQIVLKICS